jgi:maleylacetoacetate isomerase
MDERPVFELALTALPEHIDILGHVNNAVWIQWMERVSTAHWEAVAAPEHQLTYYWVVVRHEVDYLRPAHEGDRIIARTWVADAPQGAKFGRHMQFSAMTGGPAFAPSRNGRSSTKPRAGRSACPPKLWRRSGRRLRLPNMIRPILYDYTRSSAAYRVRIALNLKRVDYESRQVSLLDGAQNGDEYHALNPQGLVPALEIDGHVITQSLAIMDYLDARFPEPRFVPEDAADRAHVLAMALAVACDIHPLNNLRVLKYLAGPLGVEEAQKNAWYAKWVSEGFAALETLAAPRSGEFLFADAPTMADVMLVPQMFNARRFNVPVDAYPTLLRADANATALDAFARAHPDAQ